MNFFYFCCMHKFIEYISDLLFLHDCVIIPDFGGFICNYKSAYIDENSGLICPPSKEILFNRSLTHNDGLLVNWIACKENISYEKATTQLMLFCEDLTIRLNQRQRIVFGEIGTFYTDRRFNIIFEAGKNNFFAETLGMEPIALSATTNGRIHPLPGYINPGVPGNFLHRLLKYALTVGAIAGIVVITQSDIFRTFGNYSHDINNSGVHPALPALPSGKISCSNVISPTCDYVDYDPVNDL